MFDRTKNPLKMSEITASPYVTPENFEQVFSNIPLVEYLDPQSIYRLFHVKRDVGTRYLRHAADYLLKRDFNIDGYILKDLNADQRILLLTKLHTTRVELHKQQLWGPASCLMLRSLHRQIIYCMLDDTSKDMKYTFPVEQLDFWMILLICAKSEKLINLLKPKLITSDNFKHIAIAAGTIIENFDIDIFDSTVSNLTYLKKFVKQWTDPYNPMTNKNSIKKFEVY